MSEQPPEDNPEPDTQPSTPDPGNLPGSGEVFRPPDIGPEPYPTPPNRPVQEQRVERRREPEPTPTPPEQGVQEQRIDRNAERRREAEENTRRLRELHEQTPGIDELTPEEREEYDDIYRRGFLWDRDADREQTADARREYFDRTGMNPRYYDWEAYASLHGSPPKRRRRREDRQQERARVAQEDYARDLERGAQPPAPELPRPEVPRTGEWPRGTGEWRRGHP